MTSASLLHCPNCGLPLAPEVNTEGGYRRYMCQNLHVIDVKEKK